MSRSTLRALLAVIGVGVFAACGETHETQTFPTGPLKPGVIARVGGIEVPLTLVRDVAEARHVTPSSAANLLVEDALLAQAAHDRKLDTDPRVIAKVRAVQARLTIDQILIKQPPITATDEQVAQMSRELWAQVDRGDARRTAHAVVLSAKSGKQPAPPDTPEANGRRIALAQKIRDVVLHAHSATEFVTLAQNVPTEDLQVRVEGLPPIVEDGRAFDGSSLAAEFAKGAFAVPDNEQVSGIVATEFGWHVIYVAERMPAIHKSLDERRALATRILSEKAAKSTYDAHVDDLRKQYPVEISQAATTDIMTTISPSP